MSATTTTTHEKWLAYVAGHRWEGGYSGSGETREAALADLSARIPTRERRHLAGKARLRLYRAAVPFGGREADADAWIDTAGCACYRRCKLVGVYAETEPTPCTP